MRILVCGGRKYGKARSERDHIYRELYERTLPTDPEYMLPDPSTFIMAGDAKGADSVALDWAIVTYSEFQEFKADWTKYGKSAGPIRNQQMIDEGKPDLVLAFPGGAGTADMVRRALAAGIKVIRCVSPGVAEVVQPKGRRTKDETV